MNLFLKFKKYFIISIMFILFIVGLIIIYFTNYNNFKPVYAASDEIKKKEEKEDKTEEVIIETVKQFYVDIKGEVVNPGVYLVNENNIVNDVINLAGGLNKYANTKCINLSKKVFESMVIYVYSNTETRELLNNKTTSSTSNVCNNITNNAYTNINDNSNNNTNNTTQSTDTNITSSELININNADVNKLTELPGIGESKANDIIKYREENGGFKNIEELKNVSGIGNSTFEKLKSLITV